mgnify:CR=1 FL=1
MSLTKQDVIAMVGTVKVNYPFAYKEKGYSNEDLALLGNVWYENLKSYPREIVLEAFSRSLRVCKIAVTLADIIEQIDKMQAAFQPSANEKWQELKKTLYEVYNLATCFNYTYVQENGLTQGQNARNKVHGIFNSLPSEVQRYCGNASGLKDLAMLDDEQLEFEKARFLKVIGEYKKETDLRLNNPQLQSLIESTVKTLDRGKQ